MLELPAEILCADVNATAFSVYCERVDGEGAVARVVERPTHTTHLSRGYVDVSGAYVCDASGFRVDRGDHVALELPECELRSRINVTSVTAAEYVENRFVVTQTAEMFSSEGILAGLAFDECAKVLSPALEGWSHGRGGSGGLQLSYACFDPRRGEKDRPDASSALVVWLHGASDGGSDVRLPYTASHVTLLAEGKIQGHFDGGAWLLVPQCPTFWMDDGEEQMGRSGESVYCGPLKSLIDEFIHAHPDIDLRRIVIGGLSKGGFMTLRAD